MPRTGSGPIPARIMLVGEAWGEHEERELTPFVGPSGQELNRLLHDAKIMRSECYVTNLVNARPPSNDMTAWIPLAKREIGPQHVPLLNRHVLPIVKEGYDSLMFEIERVQPKVIIAFGNWAMWALTQKFLITKWRGSMLEHRGIPVIPTIHPVNLFQEWYLRPTILEDIRRATRYLNGTAPEKPKWNFILRPSFEKAINTLHMLHTMLDDASYGEIWLDFDIETRAGHIACAGISWSRTEAICLPFMERGKREGYWPVEEEAHVVWWLYRVLTHPRANIRGQNLLYDCQYTHKHWHFVPRVKQDTMISHHSVFSDLPKSLAYQASMMCEWFVFWKDEGKNI